MAEGGPVGGQPLFKKRTGSRRQAHRISSYETTFKEGTAQDESVSVDKLVSLRGKLRKPTGIELSRLNEGHRKRHETETDTNYKKEEKRPSKGDQHLSHFVRASDAPPPASPDALNSTRQDQAVAPSDTPAMHSNAILTSVPEVDLGLQARLENIEATEKAKRALMQRPIPNLRPHPEPSTLDEARRQVQYGPPPSQAPRKERATDDQVYKRFRRRIMR